MSLRLVLCLALALKVAASGVASDRSAFGSSLHIVQASQELPASVYQGKTATATGVAHEDASFANPPRADVQASLNGAAVHLPPYTSAFADNDDLLSFS